MLRFAVIFVVFFMHCADVGAFGLTADQMYRNLMRSESDDSLSAALRREKKADEPVMTFKKRAVRTDSVEPQIGEDRSVFKAQYNWNDIVVAVRRGQVSPFDLEEIRRLSEHENAEAIELLAWMYATGTGIRQDLSKSYAYYLHAAHLGVPSASDNVRVVYQAMTPTQRSALPNF